MRETKRKVIGTICLGVSSFLNPFGFDILVYKLTQLTNDYWYSMVVLYFLGGLFFGLSYLLFKLGKRTLGNVAISTALFLNPFGYDLVVYGINQLTNEYWITMGIMYVLAGTFFGLFMYLYRINPIKRLGLMLKTLR